MNMEKYLFSIKEREAQELNRNFIGIEKELDFVNIIKKRLKDGN